MFDRVSTVAAKASFAGLYLIVFGWMLSSMLSSLDSWWVALASLAVLSPLVVLIGNFVIGPLSLAIGLAAATLASTTAALIRFARS
jgi:hypothetical protein